MDEPVAFEPEFHRNDLARGFEVLPDAREPLITVPDEMPLHLKRRGHAERAEGADRGLAKRGRTLWNRSDGRSKPGIRESPTPPAPEPTRWDDPALEPEEREGIRNRTPGAPAGFVLLRVLLEVRGADRTIGRKPLEDELAEPSSRREPGRGRASVGPGRRQREVQRAVLGGNDRRLMSPVLIEAALVPEQGVDQRWIVRTETAEDHEEMAASDDGGRVKLQAADRPHQGMDVVGRDPFRARAAEPLARDGQAPRVLDPDLAAHDRELCLSQSRAPRRGRSALRLQRQGLIRHQPTV